MLKEEPCNEDEKGVPGVFFVSADWLVRVFWLSDIVYIPSNCLYIRTFTLYGCMDRRSRYIPFYSQA